MQIPDHLKNKRLRRGNLGSVEQDEFCDIIVSFVSLAGGAILRPKIIDAIHTAFSAQFSAEDFALLGSQTPPKERWIHNVDWAKRKLGASSGDSIIIFDISSPIAMVSTWPESRAS